MIRIDCIYLSKSFVYTFTLIFAFFFFFFFNDTATTEIYTLSLHDALPTCSSPRTGWTYRRWPRGREPDTRWWNGARISARPLSRRHGPGECGSWRCPRIAT